MAVRYNVTGLDISEDSLNEARTESEKRNMPVKPTFVTGSAYELPFTNETFDVVVISDVLEHLHDLQLTVKEISRVLKPNGILVFDTISRTLYSYLFIWLGAQQILGLFPRDAHDWRMFITPEEMVILLQSHAFTIGLVFFGCFRNIFFIFCEIDLTGKGSSLCSIHLQ